MTAASGAAFVCGTQHLRCSRAIAEKNRLVAGRRPAPALREGNRLVAPSALPRGSVWGSA